MLSTLIILGLLIIHWYSSLFFQTVFLHRYASHNMFKLSPFMERVFYFGTFITQGSSFLNPRAYAILHKLHHKYSDQNDDPHSPVKASNVMKMMLHTFNIYKEIIQHPERYDHIQAGVKEWKALDKFADAWITRILFGAAFFFLYMSIAEYWWQFAFLPMHWLMGPIHGAIVNWCGHKYGYQNFDNGDNSKNTLPIDFLMMGELYQNNHHKFPTRLKFAAKKFEIDFGYLSVYFLKKFKIIKMA